MRYLLAFIKSPITTNFLIVVAICIMLYNTLHLRNDVDNLQFKTEVLEYTFTSKIKKPASKIQSKLYEAKYIIREIESYISNYKDRKIEEDIRDLKWKIDNLQNDFKTIEEALSELH